MKYVRNREKLHSSAIKANLPKDFELKLLGKLIVDLEELTDAALFVPEVTEHLKHAFETARQFIRSKDTNGLACLAGRLGKQSMLTKRLIAKGASAQAFYIQYQLSSFLKKFPFKGVDTKSPAIATFARSEMTCKCFNDENYKALLRMNQSGHPVMGGCVEDIKADIEQLLGEIPRQRSVEEYASHGPGVSLGPEYKEGKSTSYYKWANLPYSVTEAAAPYAKEAILTDPRWIGALDNWYRQRCGNSYAPINMEDFWSRVLKIVDGSRISTVPKTGLTDRTIAIEPLLNVFLQLGVDKIIKRRLKKRWGYNLLSQLKNQLLAKLGSLNGEYATLDLKAASDTISLMICELLLPPAWYNLLLDLRSPKGVLGKFKGSFEKISSMGNGFTFALESLIFGAVVRHCMRRSGNHGETSVYGDDLIVPTAITQSTIELLEYCGFAVNTEKSFVDGPFRESCGADWFHGYDVRPVFLKKQVRTVMDLYYIHNRLFELEEKLDWTWQVHFKHTREFIRKYIPKKFDCLYGPPSESLDSYLFSNRKSPGTRNTRYRLGITAKPRVFNSKSKFFFRKLMCPLKGSSIDWTCSCSKNFFRALVASLKAPEHSLSRWDRIKLLTSGNAFDITKRDSVQYFCTKTYIAYW